MDPNTELFSKLSRRMRVVEGPEAEASLFQRPCDEAGATKAPVLKRSASSHVRRRRLTLPSAFSPDADDSISPDRKQLRRIRRVRVPVAFAGEGSECRPQVPASWQPVLSHSYSSPPTFRSFQYTVGVPKTTPTAGAPKTLSKSEEYHEQLLRQVERAETERTAAQREALAAEEGAAARGAELREEVLRLRERAASLREGLLAAKSDEGFFEIEGVAVRARKSSWEQRSSLNGNSRQNMLNQTQNLAAQLEERSSNCTDLYNRLQSLEAEFQNQVAERRRLHEQVEVSRTATAEGQQHLEFLLFGAVAEDSGDDSSEVESDAAEDLVTMPRLLSPTRSDGGGLLSARTSSALPPKDHLFDLTERPRSSRASLVGAQISHLGLDVGPDDEEDRSPSSSSQSSHVEPEMSAADDLEFAYEWGLEMSTKMSVHHALKLATWASRGRRTCSVDEGDEEVPIRKHSMSAKEGAIGAEEATSSLSPSRNGTSLAEGGEVEADINGEAFSAPLAELQDALAVLQSVSSRRSVGEAAPIMETPRSLGVEMSGFQSAIADLQQAIAQMSPPPPAEPDPVKPFELDLDAQPKFSLFEGEWTDMDAPGQHITVIKGDTLKIFDGTISRIQVLATNRIAAFIAGSTYYGILHEDGLLRWDFGGVWGRPQGTGSRRLFSI